MKPSKRKAPSRTRYEQANPTVSWRVTKELYDRLKAIKEKESRSFADILRTGLGIIEPRAQEKEEATKKGLAEGYKKGYNEGHKKGYAEAEQLFKVTYPCTICRRTLAITSAQEKQAVTKYMVESGWGHEACHNMRR